MKQREPRRKVMLSARLRQEEGWSDANILNVSSRGLLLHGTIRPARGSYLEVRRGSYVIVGRVIWVEANRFGVRTQENLSVDSLISSAQTALPANGAAPPFVERRARPRSEGLEWRYARSRERGRSVQFAMIAATGLLLALFVFETAGEVLAAPLTEVTEKLAVAG